MVSEENLSKKKSSTIKLGRLEKVTCFAHALVPVSESQKTSILLPNPVNLHIILTHYKYTLVLHFHELILMDSVDFKIDISSIPDKLVRRGW